MLGRHSDIVIRSSGGREEKGQGRSTMVGGSHGNMFDCTIEVNGVISMYAVG